MNRKRSVAIRRFASSVAIALPMTIALLFLMTRLILPGEQDRMVTRMIRNIEFQRVVPAPDPTAIQHFKPPSDKNRLRLKPHPAAMQSRQVKTRHTSSTANPVAEEPAHSTDWWAAADRLTQDAGEEAFEQWLLEQGHERYVSIMQGPLPIRNSVRGTLPPTQEDVTGYLNIYGDLELKVSQNCVIQTQVAARHDASDFARNLPMRIVCKSAPKVELSFDRE